MNKDTPLTITGDEVGGFLTMKPSEVFVHEGRFRPLDEDAVKVIAESIEVNGQLQPILVTPNGDLIDGNHRLHACKLLKVNVTAQVLQEMDIDKLSLIEIDSNLCRKELSKTEFENHLATRKKLYNTLYPDTAKRGAKGEDSSGKKSFGEDTAVLLGKSAKTVERIVKRGENASEELQEARDNKEITTSDMDEIIAETGDNKEAQLVKMKDLIQQKVVKTEAKKEETTPPETKEESDASEGDGGEGAGCGVITDNMQIELVSKVQELENIILELRTELETKKTSLKKANQSVKNLQERIAKAKSNNPDVKI